MSCYYQWKQVYSYGNGRYTVDNETDREATQPLSDPEPLQRPLQAVFNVDKSEWATNELYTIHRKEWTPTTHTYEVYVCGDRKYVAGNIEPDLQSFLRSEYERHVAADFDEYFERQKWFDVTEPIWKKGDAL